MNENYSIPGKKKNLSPDELKKAAEIAFAEMATKTKESKYALQVLENTESYLFFLLVLFPLPGFVRKIPVCVTLGFKDSN